MRRAGEEALGQLGDGLRLIAGRLIRSAQLEHDRPTYEAPALVSNHAGVPKS